MRRGTVVVIDADNLARTMAEKIVTSRKFHCISFDSIERGLQCILTIGDVLKMIILDLDFNQNQISEVAQNILSSAKFKHIPLILCSRTPHKGVQIITKPITAIDFDELCMEFNL